jgi:hypothetical protein
MKYNNLEDWARRDVWTTFLNLANTNGGTPSISTAEMDHLVAFVSKGRQVRLMYIIACFSIDTCTADQKLRSTRPYSRERRPGSLGYFLMNVVSNWSMHFYEQRDRASSLYTTFLPSRQFSRPTDAPFQI